MISRQQAKRRLRIISEIAIIQVIGRIPRKLRRSAGREFANASYRVIQGLPKLNPKVNTDVINWIVKQFNDLSTIGNQNLGIHPAVNGSAAPTVAD